MISFLPMIFFWIENHTKPSEETAITGKHKAMYPDAPKQLLRKQPEGILFGKDKKTGKYICKSIEEDFHILIIGGSGSGKSSCLAIPAILLNHEICKFVIDIKGELSAKATKRGDANVLIFNPSDRNTWGYNPFYLLDEESSMQSILETMQSIATSLIDLNASVKDPFWKMSARGLLVGLLIYYYKQGIHDFVSCIDAILSKPVKEAVQEVMDNTKTDSVEYKYLVQYQSMEEATLGGIVAELANHVSIFVTDQDIRYAFKDNGCKINPYMLEEGYSIFLSIREEKLSAYYDLLQLVINQTLSQLEKRPEDSEPVIVILDELPRLVSVGKIDKLLDSLHTLRSRKVHLILISQSTEALMSAYTESEVIDIMSNCSCKIILDASSERTAKTVCGWCGKYKAKKQSWNGNGKITVSYEEKDIVEPSDLMTLQNSGEAILISQWGYNRILKCPYYKEKMLCAKAEEIKKYNEAVKL